MVIFLHLKMVSIGTVLISWFGILYLKKSHKIVLKNAFLADIKIIKAQ